MNPRIDGPLTSDEQRMVTRIMQPIPDIDRSLIEGLVRLGLGGHVVKSCEELRKQIRQLGGP